MAQCGVQGKPSQGGARKINQFFAIFRNFFEVKAQGPLSELPNGRLGVFSYGKDKPNLQRDLVSLDHIDESLIETSSQVR